MSRDGGIWDLMREHARERVDDPPVLDSDATNDASHRNPAWSDSRRDATVRVLDAAVGVVGSTRHLLAVLEDVLREQRDRVVMGATPPSPVDGEVDGDDRSGRERIDLTF